MSSHDQADTNQTGNDMKASTQRGPQHVSSTRSKAGCTNKNKQGAKRKTNQRGAKPRKGTLEKRIGLHTKQAKCDNADIESQIKQKRRSSTDEPRLVKRLKANPPREDTIFEEPDNEKDTTHDNLDETADNIPEPEGNQVWKGIDEKWFTPLSTQDSFAMVVNVVNKPLQENEVQRELEKYLRRLDFVINNQRLHQILSLSTLLRHSEAVASKQSKNKHEEAIRIKDVLQFNKILRSMVVGFSDKTELEVYSRFEAVPLQKKGRDPPEVTHQLTSLDPKVDTQCKICFNCSSESEPCSTIVYCDKCGTSFHQYCYGLPKLPPASKRFYCDCCEEHKELARKPQLFCRICRKQNFPMRKLNGHYFHVTCLFLNNLIVVKQGKLQFKDGFDLDVLDKAIRETERDISKDNGFCEFCVNQREMRDGMQCQCSHTSCRKWFHPICAYLNGCEFNARVEQDKGGRLKLLLMIHCNDHNVERNYHMQTYLRRYSLNLFGAFKQTFVQFSESYKRCETKRLNEVNKLRRLHLKLAPTIKQQEQAGFSSGQQD